MAQFHGKKKIAGTVYDLTHLDSFLIYVPKKGAGNYRIRVDFGVHTFTKEYTPLHTPDLSVPDGKNFRAFCLDRYARSLSLPAIIKSAIEGVVLLSNGNTIIAGPLPGRTDPYLAAFKIIRQETKKYDCVMTVISAHERPGFDTTVLLSAPFKAVVSNAFAGSKIDWKKK